MKTKYENETMLQVVQPGYTIWRVVILQNILLITPRSTFQGVHTPLIEKVMARLSHGQEPISQVQLYQK